MFPRAQTNRFDDSVTIHQGCNPAVSRSPECLQEGLYGEGLGPYTVGYPSPRGALLLTWGRGAGALQMSRRVVIGHIRRSLL